MVVDGLVGDGMVRMWLVGAGNKSVNDQGRETKWSVAPEAVWKCGAAGSGAPRKGDPRLPGAAEETDGVGGQTASGAWAGTAQYSGRPEHVVVLEPSTVHSESEDRMEVKRQQGVEE